MVGRRPVCIAVQALVTEGDLPDAEPVQQLLNVGLIEPDDEAVRPRSTKQALSQCGEIDFSVHHGVEHVGEVAPLADASPQCPLGPAARTGVVLLDPRTRAAQRSTIVVSTGQEVLLSAPGTAAAATDGL
jgi:hypothetical protein